MTAMKIMNLFLDLLARCVVYVCTGALLAVIGTVVLFIAGFFALMPCMPFEQAAGEVLKSQHPTWAELRLILIHGAVAIAVVYFVTWSFARVSKRKS